jgi:hypothetical protein
MYTEFSPQVNIFLNHQAAAAALMLSLSQLRKRSVTMKCTMNPISTTRGL